MGRSCRLRVERPKLPEFLPRAIYEMENASLADNLEIQQRIFEKYGSDFGILECPLQSVCIFAAPIPPPSVLLLIIMQTLPEAQRTKNIEY